MKPLIRCKVCGYVATEGSVHDVCPACGAPRTAFETFTDRVSWRRRRILGLTLHPIAAHFPVSFAVAAIVLSLTPPFFSGTAESILLCTLKFVVLFLPVLAAMTLIIGLYDGRVRFKTIRRSPILRRKVQLAAALFIVSLGLTAAVWSGNVSTTGLTPLAVLPALVALLLVFVLGLLGTKVRGAAMPGDWVKAPAPTTPAAPPAGSTTPPPAGTPPSSSS
jgi:rubredoxin